MFLKSYKPALRKAILDAIDFSGYDVTQPTTDDEKILLLVNICRDEVLHEINRNGTQKGMEYWLSGLPSCINLPFVYSDIVNFAVSIGSVIDPTSKEEEKIVHNFFNFISANILQMHTAAITRRMKS